MISTIPHKADTRISAALREALRLHFAEGFSISASAQKAGLTRQGLSKALKRPAVVLHGENLQERLLTDLARRRGIYQVRALDVLADLMANGKSEATRLRAAEILAAVPKGPAVAVQVNNHAQTFGGYSYPSRDRYASAQVAQVVNEDSDAGEDPT